MRCGGGGLDSGDFSEDWRPLAEADPQNLVFRSWGSHLPLTLV